MSPKSSPNVAPIFQGTENITTTTESKKRKSSEGNSGSIHPYGRYGNAGKTSKTISTIAILWPVKAIFEEGRYGGGRYFCFPCISNDFLAGGKVFPPNFTRFFPSDLSNFNEVSLSNFTTHFCGHGNPNHLCRCVAPCAAKKLFCASRFRTGGREVGGRR